MLVHACHVKASAEASSLLLHTPVFVWLQWRLLSWAWLICLAFLPEMAAKAFVRSPCFDSWRHSAGEGPGCCVASLLLLVVLLQHCLHHALGHTSLLD
jgi:hypothetical protein